ncbi:MAG: c-type cytochrome [Bryobacteraceae bacterium]|jgi:cytochrome c2
MVRRTAAGHRLLMWPAIAVSTSVLLAGGLISRHNGQNRWSIFMVGDPGKGARLFFDKEGCAQCHSVNGTGAGRAPDLGSTGTPYASINQLVSAIWNHAPQMWERMRTEGRAYPQLTSEDMAHLFAFLCTARYLDEPGDENKGRAIFRDKGCVLCHSIGGVGGEGGPDLSNLALETPISWAQSMWNHAPAMQKTGRRIGLSWPRFAGREMNDLLSYLRANSKTPRRAAQLLPADPDHGSKLFRSKFCITCHAVQGKGGHAGPELGAHQALTIAEFSGIMWNHSPDMWRTPDPQPIPFALQTELLATTPLPPPRAQDALMLGARPTLDGREIADLVAFLSRLRYFEPLGSAQAGQTVFAHRGCQDCHGSTAEGGKSGPGLRGRGVPTTAITLATALWQHGPRMYQRIQGLGRRWPRLEVSDVGDIAAFLNSPVEGKN